MYCTERSPGESPGETWVGLGTDIEKNDLQSDHHGAKKQTNMLYAAGSFT